MTKNRCRRLEQALVHLQVAATYLKALSNEERAAADNLPSNIKRERGAVLEANAATLDEAVALIAKAGGVVSRANARSWASAARPSAWA